MDPELSSSCDAAAAVGDSTISNFTLPLAHFDCTAPDYDETDDDVSFQLDSCSRWTIFVVFVSLYLSLAVITNIIAFYNAWSLISEAWRVDLANIRPAGVQRKKREYLKTIQAHVHVDAMKDHMDCPICLVDFYEGELVTACEDGGCGNWFHRDCLTEWLERANTCPCCRKDLSAPTRKRSWLQDLSAAWGYGPASC